MTPEEFQKKMEKSQPRMMKLLAKEMKKVGLKIEKEAKTNATYFPRVRTGRLRSSINSKVIDFQGSPRILTQAGKGSAVKYAAFVEFGTEDPEPPRLFYSKQLNGFRYASKGIKPRLFVGHAVEKERRDMPAILKKLMKLTLVGN
ncbi:hypothetical protein CL634_09345 [bacterium]|nr:hypothetical protein [bacterium]|tara:strand:+ start:715 stop:1149 length:435 start_codon:yes stop_codon:yes gene_type:complete